MALGSAACAGPRIPAHLHQRSTALISKAVQVTTPRRNRPSGTGPREQGSALAAVRLHWTVVRFINSLVSVRVAIATLFR